MTAPATLTDGELGAVANWLGTVGVSVTGPLLATPISGGRSNLTFRIRDTAGFAGPVGPAGPPGSGDWVLRMPPRTGRTPSAHDVGREFRVVHALAGSGVPVAPAVGLCTDESLIGGPFAIFGFVPGVTVQTAAQLEALAEPVRAAAVQRVVETLSALHAVDHRAAGLGAFGRADGYAARQLRRWSGQWEIVGDNKNARAATELIDRLRASLPVDDGGSAGIVHGDYRIDNTLLDLTEPDLTEPDGGVRVLAVVDWELSTIGDPVADVAMMCAYREPALDLVLGAPSAWTSPLMPDAGALAASYEAAGGRPLVSWDFHLALAHFKIAVIAAGIAYRRREGSGSGPGFDTADQAVGPFLAAGLAASRTVH